MPEQTQLEALVTVRTGAGKTFDAGLALKALESLLEGDETEQRETLEELKRGLDEHRLPGSKLFP